ncbi:MAG TPA: WecB/TagA/CpsF family glycosyltransferase [Candidatus Binatia bacterium]|nr:WecB/TagA/CpsF family glycosyltransferase [Candidatus Binatia bacterium]
MWTNQPISVAGDISEYAEPSALAGRQPQHRPLAPSSLPVSLLGVAFDNLSVTQAIARIEDMIASRKAHYAVTANIDFCVQALQDVELRRILFDAHLVLCDGTPLVWASRLVGNPLPERVAGADLVPRLIRRAAEQGYRVFFLGGSPQSTEQAVARLQSVHPNLIIAGHYSPPFRALLDLNHGEICDTIRAARPDLLFVSFGCPKAEKWMAMHYRNLGVPVAMGVGATIDFLAGRVRRAPEWMQRAGAEWLYRLGQEPRRLWRRYANDIILLGGPLLAQLWSQKQILPRRATDSHTTITMFEPTWIRVCAPERFDYQTLIQDAPLWNELGTQHCLLDLSAVKFIDSTALAALIQLQRRFNFWRLVLLAPSERVMCILRRFKLESFFQIAADTLEARDIIANADATQHPESELYRPVPPIIWSGELTAANAEDVWSSTQLQIDALYELGDTTIDIDLAGLRFLDSTGVGIMLRAKRYAQNLGAALRFTNPQVNVRNVLRMARLETFLVMQ